MSADRIIAKRERREAAARSALDGLTLEEKIERGRANAENRAADALPELTLPDAALVDLVTLTKHELHDLIYNAASVSMRHSMPSMTKQTRQLNAERIANEALLIVRGQDYEHRGPDPRG